MSLSKGNIITAFENRLKSLIINIASKISRKKITILRIVIFLVKILELLGKFKTNVANSRKKSTISKIVIFLVKILELLGKIKTNIANSRKNQ